MTSRILVFENGLSEQQFLQSCLEPKFETYIFGDARNCIEKTLEIEPDLILIDLGIESINVLEARAQLRKHRSTSKIPVLLISTLQDIEVRCCGPKQDFVIKPLQRQDVLAQIEERLSQARGLKNGVTQNPNHITAGDLAIDSERRIVFLGAQELSTKNRLQIDLSTAEHDLLKFFMQNEGVTFARVDIQKALEIPQADRSIDSLVFQLRRELKPVAHYFKTVYGKGYRFQSGPRTRNSKSLFPAAPRIKRPHPTL